MLISNSWITYYVHMFSALKATQNYLGNNRNTWEVIEIYL